jgi:hypothetical protein
MFSFLKKIKIPKTTLTCLLIVAIVLVALYFTGFINKDKLPFEHYEEAKKCDPNDDSISGKIACAYSIATS